MDVQELTELTIADLRERESQLRKEFFNLRFQKTLGQLADPMRIRAVRRDIARVLTFIRKKK